MAVTITEKTLIAQIDSQQTHPIKLEPLRVPTLHNYEQLVQDLQFAANAGDTEFAPAMKTLLREALQLTLSSSSLPISSYQLALASIKNAYQHLLRMNVTHPVARRLQAGYRDTYSDTFWDFLENIRLLSKPVEVTCFVSEANVDKNAYFIVKRILDVVLATTFIILLLPLLLAIAILIRLESHGPVIFEQQRVGTRRRCRNGLVAWELQMFSLYKFRSMVQSARQSRHHIHTMGWTNGYIGKGKLNISDDPRLTRIGRLMCRTHLDNLPQLFNVLKGDMSLVGPRPPLPYHAQHEWLPTMVGLSGIVHEVNYLQKQSLWLDLKILLYALLFRQGRK